MAQFSRPFASLTHFAIENYRPVLILDGLLTVENWRGRVTDRKAFRWNGTRFVEVSSRAAEILDKRGSAQSRASVPAQTPRQTKYFIRLFNCDDYCTAELNGAFLYTTNSTGFGGDSGWLDLTEGLQEGRNRIKLSVHNFAGGVTYGFQIRKNETLVFEQICGRAGIVGCDNNRTFPNGVAREFSYEVRMSPAETRPAHTRWLSFLTAFRAAVNKRDRGALRGMIATPFYTPSDEVINSPDEVIKWIDKYRLWRELQREVASGSSTFIPDDRGRPTRYLGTLSFELGSDGRWRLSGQGENA